jgi:LysM repeat protein
MNTECTRKVRHPLLYAWKGSLFVVVLVALWLPALFGPAVPSAQAQEVIYHTVQPGESLTKIARQYGVTVSELVRRNNITNINVLRVGQRLIIPTSGGSAVIVPTRAVTPAPAPRPVITPAPASGRSVTNPPVVGPTATATPTPAIGGRSGGEATPTTRPTWQPLASYTVRSGDTLTSIALRFGVTVSALKIRNGLRSDTIYVGQRLLIPTD